MKEFTVTVEIDLPRERVIELFDNTDNLPKWQNGLQSFEHLGGEPGQVGAKSKLIFIHGRNTIELIETITKRDPPDEFNGSYAWKGGHNTLHNRFTAVSENRTRWESTCRYKFGSFMLRTMGLFVPGMFRKQTLKYLQNFKAFAEEGKDVREEGRR